MNYVKAERIWLKTNPQLNEQWVQGLIAADPSILGLGPLEVRDRERPQPRAGRLDLLLQDSDPEPPIQRYEVEIQLGPTDESHIIRTIEYWDIERKRYPQYEHCAVIVAEDITSRFLNVISLFNSAIPLIAIQMAAFRFGEQITLMFTTVMDELTRGPVEEDEPIQTPTTRGFWEERGGKERVALADRLLQMVKKLDPTLELNYKKYYIGLARNGMADNFVVFRPLENQFRLEVRLPSSPEIDTLLSGAGLSLKPYDRQWRRYRILLTEHDLDKHREVLGELLEKAYEHTR